MEPQNKKTVAYLEWGVLFILLGILALMFTYIKTAYAEYEPIPNQNSAITLGTVWAKATQGGFTDPDNDSFWIQQLGSGLTGYLTGMQFKIWKNVSYNFDSTTSIKLFSIDPTDSTDLATYNAMGYDGDYNVWALDTERLEATTTVIFHEIDDNQEETVSSTFDPVQLDPSRKYFIIASYAGTGNQLKFKGITNFQYVGGTASSTHETILSAIYMQFFGDTAIANNTKIVALNNPLHGTTEASTTVEFSFTYNYADTNDVDIAGFEVRDIFTGTSQGQETPIIASGESTITFEKTLTAGNYHLWWAYLKDSETGTRKYVSGKNGFNVVTINSFFPTSPPIFDPADTSATSSMLASIFGQQGYFANKFPFAYIYDVGMLMSAMQNTATENNFPQLGIDMGSTSLSVGTLTLFSSSTVSQYAGSSTLTILRTIMQSVLWLSFMAMVFFTVKGLFK